MVRGHTHPTLSGVLEHQAPAVAGAHRERARPRIGPAVWLILLFALVLRLGYVAVTPDYKLVDDATDYDRHARSIASGNGYADVGLPGRATAFRPPGYTYFLGAVYAVTGVKDKPERERVLPGRIANALVGTLVVALIGLIAAQLWSRRAALVAMALGAVYIPLITVGGAIMSEILFAALLLGSLAAAIQHRRSSHRWRWALLAGFLGGLTVLTRANALVLLVPLAFAVWDARPRRSWRSLGPPVVLVVVALLAVTPWTIRNAVVFHQFVPVSTQLGSALAGTYNTDAMGDTKNPASWRSLRRVDEYKYLTGQWKVITEAQLEQKLRAASIDFIKEHPSYVLKVMWWDTRRALDLASWSWSRHTASTISISPGWSDAGVICFWVFALLALGGVCTRAARTTPWWVWAMPALVYLGVVAMVFETPRYRTGIDPFIVMLAALAVLSLAARRARVRDPAPAVS
jgi:4-amino-4-deoxy-L-arabinose transferase-like glycosyltransferase